MTVSDSKSGGSKTTSAPSSRRFAEGLAVRQAVLGEDYVAKSMQNADEFSRPLQELIVEYCWGTIWTRSGLSRKVRSLLNLGIMAALGRPNELRLHMRGALNNGCTREEILEVILQVAVYCGIPAALDAHHVAREILAETD
jgi:4-carboxymuconolactone decarboxylase